MSDEPRAAPDRAEPGYEPPIQRVPASRRAPIATLVVLAALVVLLVAEPWAAPPASGPVAAASTAPAAAVPPSAPATDQPAVPMVSEPPQPSQSPAPTSRPSWIRSPDDPTVLTPEQFAAVFASGQYVGSTLIVDGTIAKERGISGRQCSLEERCPLGRLEGVEFAGSGRPLIVWSSFVPERVSPNSYASTDPYAWPRIQRAYPPIDGLLVIRIDTSWSAEYIGRVLSAPRGLAWTFDAAAALDRTALETDDVVLVDGRLFVRPQVYPPCTDSAWSSALPSRNCGDEVWLQPEDVLGGRGVQPQRIRLQPAAWVDMFDAPLPAEWASAPEAEGTFALGARLSRGGCYLEQRPCLEWDALARLDAHVITRFPGYLEVEPVPDDGWLEIASERTLTEAVPSPDGQWLLVQQGQRVTLLKTGDASIVRTYEAQLPTTPPSARPARWPDSFGAALWLDERRFLLLLDRLDVEHGKRITEVLLGNVRSARLVEVNVPRTTDSQGGRRVHGLPNGQGAIAFSTTKETRRECDDEPCSTFRIWTRNSVSPRLAGEPIAWSARGDRLAIVRNDPAPTGDQAPNPVGAGQHGLFGRLEVLSWPALEVVHTQQERMLVDGLSFDPFARYLAVSSDRGLIIDLHTDRLWALPNDDWPNPPVWDSAGRLIVAGHDGDVVALDIEGNELHRWSGMGNHVVGTAGGEAAIAYFWQGGQGLGPNGVFSILRRDTAETVALPEELLAEYYYVTVAPGGGALVVGRGGRGLVLHTLE
jgi:hypothetical protein